MPKSSKRTNDVIGSSFSGYDKFADESVEEMEKEEFLEHVRSVRPRLNPDNQTIFPPIVRRWHERHRTPTVVSGVSRVDDTHVDACDINAIIRRYDNTGSLPLGREGVYADVSGLNGDLTEQINSARDALTKVNDHVESVKKSKRDKVKQEQADLVDEVKRLREQVSNQETVDKSSS